MGRSLLEEGKWEWIERFGAYHTIYFQRIQLNFHADLHKVNNDKFLQALKSQYSKQYIFQLDNVNNDVLYLAMKNYINAVGLFDTSGGAGILPNQWPEPISAKSYVEGGHGDTDEINIPVYSGYAGGLSPDNLKEQLESIQHVVDCAWNPHSSTEAKIFIDCETHVRSNNDKQFDLDKVRQFLEIAKPFVDQKAVEYRKRVTGI